MMAFEPLIHFMRGIQGKLNAGTVSGVSGGQNSHQVAFIRQLQKEMKLEKALHVPLKLLDVIVFDFETTGFFPEKGDEIISIGAVKISKGEVQENSFYSLVRYKGEISAEIEELTGITNDELKGAPQLSEVLIKFFDFVQDLTLVAHHVNHEKSFLQNACWKNFRSPLKHRLVDTSFLYRIAEPNLKILKLEDFCEHNGIPIVARHHALGDAKLTAKLWNIYVDKVNQLGCKTLSDVYERLARL